MEMFFFCLLCAFLPSLTTWERIVQKFAKTKMGYISLPSIFSAIMGITSSSCEILKMVILHEWGFYVFLEKRRKTCFFLINPKKLFFQNKTKKTVFF